MDDSVNKGIFIPIALVLTLLAATFCIRLYNKTNLLHKQANVGLDTMNQSLGTKNFNQYDNQTVSGASVISAINTKASSQVIIHVKTNAGSKDYSSASYNIKDVSDPNYIEENGKFKSTLNKNQNRSVVGITFVQVSSGYYDNDDGTNTGGDDNGDNDTGSNIDLTNLIPENVRENVTINGVTGTLKPASSIDLTNLKPENIKKGVTINKITGTLDVSSLGGKNWASGSVTPLGDTLTYHTSYVSSNWKYIHVSNLTFKPRLIILFSKVDDYRYTEIYSNLADSMLEENVQMHGINSYTGSNENTYLFYVKNNSNIKVTDTEFLLPVQNTTTTYNWIAIG